MANQPDIDKFITLFISNDLKNAKQCAIDAGYSPRTAEAAASRLLKHVKVASAIKEYKSKNMSKLIWSKDKKLEILQELTTNCLKKIHDAQGNERLDNPAAAINAIKEHNIMQGDNEPIKQEITGQSINLNFRQATSDDINSYE